MSFYGLSTLQKNNFELASKLFVTAKKELSESLVLFLSIAKAMAYHQGRLVALVSHQSVRTVYHHTFRCVSKMLSQ